MSDNLSKDATELVREGRQALRPTDADKARVFAALQNRMAVGETPTLETSPTPITGGTAAGGMSSGKLATLTASMVAAVVALVMYTRSEPELAPVAPLPSVSTRIEAVSVAPDTENVSPVGETTAPRLEPVAPATVSVRPVPRNPESDRLAEEVALLTRAQKDFHAGNFKGALSAVDEHRRKFPKGTLVQERVNLRMQVLCGMGRDREAQAESSRLKRLAPGHANSADVCRRAAK